MTGLTPRRENARKSCRRRPSPRIAGRRDSSMRFSPAWLMATMMSGSMAPARMSTPRSRRFATPDRARMTSTSNRFCPSWAYTPDSDGSHRRDSPAAGRRGRHGRARAARIDAHDDPHVPGDAVRRTRRRDGGFRPDRRTIAGDAISNHAHRPLPSSARPRRARLQRSDLLVEPPERGRGSAESPA